jgi:hypothetical protein
MNLSYIKLIGIHGPLNGGKDTVANYIQDQYPMLFARYAFASPLKHACEVMFGFSREQIEDRVQKEAVDPFWGFSPRKAMQLLGTEYGRQMLRDDLWIRRAELEIKNNLAKFDQGTIITDVRFENEAEWVRTQENAILIYLEVPGLVRDAKYTHASEAGISRSDKDFVIVNDKSLGLPNLYEKIDKVLQS